MWFLFTYSYLNKRCWNYKTHIRKHFEKKNFHCNYCLYIISYITTAFSFITGWMQYKWKLSVLSRRNNIKALLCSEFVYLKTTYIWKLNDLIIVPYIIKCLGECGCFMKKVRVVPNRLQSYGPKPTPISSHRYCL